MKNTRAVTRTVSLPTWMFELIDASGKGVTQWMREAFIMKYEKEKEKE